MTSHLTSTGGGRGHKPGCLCSFCSSVAITGEVDLDLALSGSGSGAGFGLGAPSSASGPNPAHEAIFAEALTRIGNQRDLAAHEIARDGHAVMSASSIGRGDRIVLPGHGPRRLAVDVRTDPIHERGQVKIKFRSPLGGWDDDLHFDAYDDVAVTHINPTSTGRAPRISADRIEIGSVIADENGQFVEVRDVTKRGFLPSDPVFVCGRDATGTDREFTYLRRDEVPISDHAPLAATA